MKMNFNVGPMNVIINSLLTRQFRPISKTLPQA